MSNFLRRQLANAPTTTLIALLCASSEPSRFDAQIRAELKLRSEAREQAGIRQPVNLGED